jgi:hypothetical protein
MLTLQKFFVFGCLGMLIEVFFTSIASLIQRHWKLTGVTYGYMLFIYGGAGLILEALRDALPWPFYLRALVYLPIIYGIEAISGYLLKLFTGLLQKLFGGTGGGVIPWEYSKSAFAPFGLVNFKYLPAWFLLALSFDPLSSWLHKVLAFLATMR